MYVIGIKSQLMEARWQVAEEVKQTGSGSSRITQGASRNSLTGGRGKNTLEYMADGDRSLLCSAEQF